MWVVERGLVWFWVSFVACLGVWVGYLAIACWGWFDLVLLRFVVFVGYGYFDAVCGLLWVLGCVRVWVLGFLYGFGFCWDLGFLWCGVIYCFLLFLWFCFRVVGFAVGCW